MLKRSQTAFTLAEVLIALALLGVVAAFSVPKILTSQGQIKNRALLKETIAVLQNVTQQYCLTPQPNAVFITYFTDRLNTLKNCPVNSYTGGCYSIDLGTPSESSNPGFILPNGVMVVGFTTATIGSNKAQGLAIDLNGVSGPNTAGEDMISMVVNLAEPNPANAWGVGKCRVALSPAAPPEQQALYQSLF
jgi:prepilin-type N-terminal cleavage/methylation domain-containing protein